MSSYEDDDLQKSLKYLYDDLLDAENNREKDPSGFKNKIQVLYVNLQDLENRICIAFELGDFGVLDNFEFEYLRLGDSGVDQILKTQIKLLAVEIGLELDQNNTIPKTNSGDQIETTHRHKWTRGEKIAVVGVIATILGVVVALLV